MNEKKVNWFSLIASCFYICAIIMHFTDIHKGIIVSVICLGSCFLYLSMKKKDKNKK